MLSTAAIAAFLQASNPDMDWSATIAGLNQAAAMAAAATVFPAVPVQQPPTVTPTVAPETIPTPEPSYRPPFANFAPPTSDPSPQFNPTEVIDVSPISAYRLPADREEGEEGYAGEDTDEEATDLEDKPLEEEKAEEDKPLEEEKAEEDKPIEEENAEEDKPIEEEKAEEEMTGDDEKEIDLERNPMDEKTEERNPDDLDELAKKQGLMTEEEFEELMQGVETEFQDTEEMAEGLDLASRSVGGEIPKEAHQQSESVPSPSVEEENTEEPHLEMSDNTSAQAEAEITKPKEPQTGVKRKLIMQDEGQEAEPDSTKTLPTRQSRHNLRMDPDATRSRPGDTTTTPAGQEKENSLPRATDLEG